MTAKRCLGYPSRTAAVLGLRAKGLTTAEISARLCLRQSIVLQMEASGGSTRKRRRETAEHGRMVMLPGDVAIALADHAARRGMPVTELARCILEQVVDDGLIDAVLDDAQELVDA